MLLLSCRGSGGPARVAVHGNVAVAGKPISNGTITFVPTDGNTGPTAGAVIKDGKYSIPIRLGPVAGLNRVEIVGIHKTGRKVPLDGNMVEEVIDVVPAQYRTNPLKCDVKSGELNFDLEAN